LKGNFLIPGAEVFLSGRSKSSVVEAVANEIAAKGGLAHTTVIDTSNDATVNEYLDGIVKQTGKIDILLDFAVPLAKEYGG
jgi:3-oxoacyl-[acyl-carrier protein] reductase